MHGYTPHQTANQQTEQLTKCHAKHARRGQHCTSHESHSNGVSTECSAIPGLSGRCHGVQPLSCDHLPGWLALGADLLLPPPTSDWSIRAHCNVSEVVNVHAAYGEERRAGRRGGRRNRVILAQEWLQHTCTYKCSTPTTASSMSCTTARPQPPSLLLRHTTQARQRRWTVLEISNDSSDESRVFAVARVHPASHCTVLLCRHQELDTPRSGSVLRACSEGILTTEPHRTRQHGCCTYLSTSSASCQSAQGGLHQQEAWYYCLLTLSTSKHHTIEQIT